MSRVVDIPGPLAERQEAVEQALRDHIEASAASGLPLYRMMQYQLGWTESDGSPATTTSPHRFYGALSAEAGYAHGAAGQSERAVALAAAGMELFAQSVMAHEDMQTGNARSEERPSVWWVWGPAQAINVGDGLHALARLALFRTRELGVPVEQTLAAVRELDSLALRYYEGQYLELTYQERVDITTKQYLTMAESKGGALFGGAVALGAAISGVSPREVDGLREYGRKLGCAVQVHEDVRALWDAGAERDAHILNKSKLYPVVHALESGTLTQKRALGNIYFKRVMEPADVQALRAVLDEVGARTHAEALVDRLAAEAAQALAAVIDDGPARGRWTRIMDDLVGTT